jgi:ERCC4-type nuclease
MNHADVIIDTRERRSKVPKLLEKDLKVDYATLLFGDYVLHDEIVIERKSYEDFCHSIKDGRVFRQASDLKNNYDNPLIVIEGGPDYGKRKVWRPQLPRKTVVSAMLACSVDLGVPILPTLSAADTARLIKQAVARKDRESRPIKTFTGKKGKTLREQRQAILESFPGVGPKLAKDINEKEFSLLEIFKGIAHCDIQGLGPKKIKQIQEVLNSVKI